MCELFGSGFRQAVWQCSFFPGPVLDDFSRNHISELSGSGFFSGPFF